MKGHGIICDQCPESVVIVYIVNIFNIKINVILLYILDSSAFFFLFVMIINQLAVDVIVN